MAASDQNQDGQGQQEAKPPTFKEQLDKVAIDRRFKDSEHQHREQDQNAVIEKITEYVPAAARLLGSDRKSEEPASSQSQAPGPPERPVHDDKIGEFVRDQHRSKAEDGSLNT